MPTISQLVRKGRRKNRKKVNRALQGCPQKGGVILRIWVSKPKKPNSGQRKLARVRLTNGGERTIRLDAAVVATKARVSIGASGVAGTGTGEADLVEEGVLLAVDPYFDKFQEIAGGVALDPELVPAGAPKNGTFPLEGGLKGGHWILRGCVGSMLVESSAHTGGAPRMVMP